MTTYPEEIVDSEQVEDIIQMINDMGIKVVETAPDADDLALSDEQSITDEDAAEAAAAALSSVESEIAVPPILSACTCVRWVLLSC